MLQTFWKPFALLGCGIFLQLTGGNLFAFITPADLKEWLLLISTVFASLGGLSLTVYKFFAEKRKMKRDEMMEMRRAEREDKEALQKLRLEDERHVLEQIKALVNMGLTYEEAVAQIEKSKII